MVVVANQVENAVFDELDQLRFFQKLSLIGDTCQRLAYFEQIRKSFVLVFIRVGCLKLEVCAMAKNVRSSSSRRSSRSGVTVVSRKGLAKMVRHSAAPTSGMKTALAKAKQHGR